METSDIIIGLITLFQWTYGIVLIIVWGTQLDTLNVLPKYSPKVNKWYIWTKFYLCNPIVAFIVWFLTQEDNV